MGEADSQSTLIHPSLSCPQGELKRKAPSELVEEVPDLGVFSKRQLQEGFILPVQASRLAVQWEHFPVWLLALSAKNCAQVYVNGFHSAAELLGSLSAKGITTTLVSRMSRQLGLHRFTWLGNAAPPPGILRLVSGSLDYLQEFARRGCKDEAVLLLDQSWRGSRYPRIPGWRWSRIRHTQVGGVTKFVGLVAYREECSVKVDVTPIRRTLRHVISYGEPPGRDPPPGLTPLLEDALLPPGDLSAVWIRYPSHRSRCGLLTRRLHPLEGAIAYGIPDRARAGSVSYEMIPPVPLQILSSIIDGYLVREEHTKVPSAPLNDRPPAAIPTSTWLPGLGRSLSHAWIDKDAIAVKAAKNDNAAAPTHLWDRRITLAIPEVTPLLLDTLRSALLCRQRLHVNREFRGHLRTTFGPLWQEQLFWARACLRTGRSPWVGTEEGGISFDKDGGLKFDKALPPDVLFPPAWITPTGTRPPSGTHVPPRIALFIALLVNPHQRMILRCTQDLLLDVAAGRDHLRRQANNSWWKWDVGSSLAFWRWHPSHRHLARDGMPVYKLGEYPKNLKPARRSKDESGMAAKLSDIQKRQYIELRDRPTCTASQEEKERERKFIRSFMDYFAVPKGIDDIRLVYNGTSCGLNACLWVPKFWMPTPKSASALLDFNSCGVDVDLGEYFLNFPLPLELRELSGIDLKQFKKEMGFEDWSDDEFQVRWTRCWMGLRPSPYYAVRYYYLAEEFARGNHLEKDNPLGWSEVRLNLPGDPSFDPSKPFVFKWNDSWETIAADIIAFCDDLRASGPDEERAWQAARRIAARFQYLGIQDAPRKRKPPARQTGAWAGAIFGTSDGEVTQSVSQEKWDKAKGLIAELISELGDEAELKEISYKFLERIRGFLGHLAMTYDVLTPFLKGFHLTLASYLPQRDEEGWKLSENAFESYIRQKVEEGKIDEANAHGMLFPPHFDDIPVPKSIKPVKQLHQDAATLRKLLDKEVPPKVTVRSQVVFQVMFGFGDASGSGFGSTVLSREGLRIRIGIWEKATESNSSNWREFENVVEALEREGAADTLTKAVVYFFTDNSTVESALFKGNSSSPKLYDLVVRLKNLEMKHSCSILVSHVSGKRMISQGTDGVSRGHLSEGVTAGMDMLSFIPLNLNPIQRQPKIKEWLASWLPHDVEYLEPEGWYTRGHDHNGGKIYPDGFWRPNLKSGTFVWSLPPAAAGTAIEELRKARLKRQESTHVVICPRLFTTQWMRQLQKAADLIIPIPPGTSFWSEDMYEPLILALVFPFARSIPWQVRSTPKMFYLERRMRALLPEAELAAGDLLRKFLLEYKRVRTLPGDVVWKVLHFKPRVKEDVLPPHTPRRGRSSRKRSERTRTSPDNLERPPKFSKQL